MDMHIDAEHVCTDWQHFWSAMEIYLHKPHVVNKRVTTVRFAGALTRADRAFGPNATIDKRTLISKNPRIYDDQDEYILSKPLSITFLPVLAGKSCGVPVSGYRFEVLGDTLRLTIFDRAEEKDIVWLRDHLFPKIVKWCQSEIGNSTENTTLRLISIENYQLEYERLKTKYGKYLTENWCESTDPQKHVFEDLGIASYLITYWRQHASSLTKPIKFVDMGCGNGLLTFLLAAEGYPGLGIDMRRRRSWSLFDSSLYLESLIDPRASSLHELLTNGGYTLLIGNHSDELTPWLPVLARQCDCDVFLLPCCFFDFGGKKFATNNRSNQDEATQYEQYLAHVEKIAQILDFDVKRDKLRIPSTKSICFMLHQKNDESAQPPPADFARTRLLDRLGIDIDVEHADPQIPAHRPPASKSKPDFFSTKHSIIRHLFEHLLVRNETKPPLTLSTAFALLPVELREQLKSEKGGLKSIILSYRHALRLDPQTNHILLADPHSNTIELKQDLAAKKMFKSKPCFFDRFHPDGCPLIDGKCAFLHSQEDKRINLKRNKDDEE